MSLGRYFIIRRRNFIRLLVSSMIIYIFYISLVGFGKFPVNSQDDDLSKSNHDERGHVAVEHNVKPNKISNNHVKRQNEAKNEADLENGDNDEEKHREIAQEDLNQNINNENQQLQPNNNEESVRKILTLIDRYDNFKDYATIKNNGKPRF
jgi:hypothetical protein